jgi:predicted regulator of Ras-like GTPase activity (Roadblock/LC7/MglB family)/ribosomal protein L40E
MIICSNCGATNNEAEDNICRKCGALLPISTRPPRIRLTLDEKKRGSKSKQIRTSEKPKVQKKPNLSELQEIPSIKSETRMPIQKPETVEKYVEIDDDEEEKQILKEITPMPFEGSIIGLKRVYNSHTSPEQKQVEPHVTHSESTLIKQKQLEEDMTKVLSFLSKKITVKKLPSEPEPAIKKQTEKVIPPSSMSEILKELLKLDLHIEASAIIKKDGTILASAISSRMSDTLFATIGQNLSMIGKDIIEGLSAGKLLNISVRGSNGVVDLAPIDTENSLGNDMLLIIFSSPRIKSGIINFAANIVKKQVKQYLGIGK